MKKNILFISHCASRTGAPIILLHLLRWLKKNTDFTITILLKKDGVLKSEFEEIGETYVWDKTPSQNLFQLILKKFLPQTNNRSKKNILKVFPQKNFNLIYANTVATCETVDEIANMINCPKICHVHELEIALNEFCGKDVFIRSDIYFDEYIVVSKAVRENLINSYNIKENKIKLIYGFIHNHTNYSYSIKPVFNKNTIRNELSLSSDTIIIGACGTTDWRKAPDVFIQLAHATKRMAKNNKIVFCWIGGEDRGVVYDKLIYDIKKLNLSDQVFFMGSKTKPFDYFNDFDIFTLTSREDPFPLVCLEAASLEKPVICFDKAGGISEFVEEDAGFVVPYLDINAMAEKIILLAEDKVLREHLGNRAAEKVREMHDIHTSAQKLLTIINRYL